MRWWCLLGPWLLGAFSLVVAADESLPEPMALADALRLARDQVPLRLQAEAERMAGLAAVRESAVLDGVHLTLGGDLRFIQPSSLATNRNHNDSQAHLRLEKRLYDAGYSTARETAAQARLEAGQWRVRAARQEQALAIMRAFYDVLLADLAFARDNEAMSVAYVRLDRGRDRHALGQLSDLDLLALENRYEETHRVQLRSAARQRTARSRLALALGRPGELSSELVMPDIEVKAPSDAVFETFWERVREHHPRLRALAAELRAAREALAAARASQGPVLSARVEAGAWHRRTGSTHPLAGGVHIEWPLLDAGRREAAVARAQAALTRAQAAWQAGLQEVRQQALEAWLARKTLAAELQSLQVAGDYRDLYLDRSRARYEQEIKTDLGDAMVRISEVRLKTARVRFDWALNEARLRAMTGELLEDLP